MSLKEEEKCWQSVIKQYKTEIGINITEIGKSVEKGYLNRSEEDINLTDKGIGYIYRRCFRIQWDN